VWRLKEIDVLGLFRERVRTNAGLREGDRGGVECLWRELKNVMVEGADAACGKTKGPQRHRQSWWWNNEVAGAVKEKRRLFVIWGKTKRGDDKKKATCDEQAYHEAKRKASRVIGKAKESERRKIGESLDEEDGKGRLYRAVKQMVKRNKDVVGGGCMKDKDGKVVVEEEGLKEIWRSHFDRISNEEYKWDKTMLEGGDTVSGPIDEISCQEVRVAVRKMKSGKAAGPSGVVAEMIKAGGEVVIQWMTDLFNAIVMEGKVPMDWSKSWLVSIYKGKGDAMDCGSYRGVKLLEHVMKVFERVIEVRVRRIASIDDMQFGFSPGQGTTDAIFIVRQVQEKYLAAKSELWMAFVDLEKAFDRVPREVLWWALREVGVEEWTIAVIKSMYEGAYAAVRLSQGESPLFEVKVGVHQGSVLSPLLFIIVMEAISRKCRGGLPFELLYADDIVLMANSKEGLMERLREWKKEIEVKGLRVNMGKTKVMKCEVRVEQLVNSGKWPCGVCKKGVGNNSIQCTSCKKWIHKKCSGIRGRLKVGMGFHCMTCQGKVQAIEEPIRVKVVKLGEESLECVENFCYLGDMLGSGGGAEDASRTRVRCAWGKFNELAPIITSRGASLKLKGKIYRACVQSVLVYGSETWPMKVVDSDRLERTERAMMRWMCGVTLRDKIRSDDLRDRLGIDGVTVVVRRARLRWFGHIERKDVNNWLSACRNITVGGRVGRGRGRKTWRQCVNEDMILCGLNEEMAKDRVAWKNGIRGKRRTRASTETQTLKR
jgi:hypothetical protein